MIINFLNKTCIVTGGSSGLGEEVSKQFLTLGAKVIITGRESLAPQWTFEYENCTYKEVDFLTKISLNSFLSYINTLNQIDVLINNAGIIKFDKIGSSSYHDNFSDIIQVNLSSTIAITNEVVKVMKKSKFGRIVNVSSVSGYIAKPNQSAYAATKQGLNGFTKAISVDLAKNSILANSIMPSAIDTPMISSKLSEAQINNYKSKHPMKRLASTTDISNVIIFLSSKINSYYTGQSLIVDGGLTLN